ncbi:hypothetical protein [Thermosipho sp. (in: thermotogales)]|jgi:hypothetical protein|uniref:hypothetical protein n=1 Tax=Thermosipho sp. (in: thermotogales) TaxID=1968895 RepID=UPI002579D030|nr:hypothetical protein [Thermosipho sp. (in: thermotogales)]MBZ4649178.1 hypothetical protein [Thermosipho sp. (in: thermotogales)]
MEEIFFASYGGLITITLNDFMNMSVDDIDWFLNRLAEEKKREKNAIESAARHSRR